MPLFRKKSQSQAQRLASWRSEALSGAHAADGVGALLDDLGATASEERKGWVVEAGSGHLFIATIDDGTTLSGWSPIEDTHDASALLGLLHRNLEPGLVWTCRSDAGGDDELGARFAVPLDGFDRGAVLLALEAMAGSLGDEALATRARELREPPRGEADEQDANAGAAELGPGRAGGGRPDRRGRLRGVADRGRRGRRRGGPARHRREPAADARAGVRAAARTTSRRCAGCCSRATGAARGWAWRRCRAGRGCSPSAPSPPRSSRRRSPGASARCCSSRRVRPAGGLAVSVEMILTVAFYALLVFGYFYVVAKVWRGESEFDGDDPPSFWPFSIGAVARRGPGAAGPGRQRPRAHRRRHRIGPRRVRLQVLRHGDGDRPGRPARDVPRRLPDHVLQPPPAGSSRRSGATTPARSPSGAPRAASRIYPRSECSGSSSPTTTGSRRRGCRRCGARCSRSTDVELAVIAPDAQPVGHRALDHHAAAAVGRGGAVRRRHGGLRHRRHAGRLRPPRLARADRRLHGRPDRLRHQPRLEPRRRHHLLRHGGGGLRGRDPRHPRHRDLPAVRRPRDGLPPRPRLQLRGRRRVHRAAGGGDRRRAAAVGHAAQPQLPGR